MIDPANLRLLEAVLFGTATPLDETALAKFFPDDTDLAELLGELVAHYTGRGVNLVRRGDGWAFRTAPDLAQGLATGGTEQKKLSRAALETLAIVAYHQPVTRAEIEAIRGVRLGKGTLDILFEAGWVRPRGRKEVVGRPVLWATTPAFLDHFGLTSLKDLPGVEELKAAGLLDTRPETTTYGASAPGPEQPMEGDLFDTVPPLDDEGAEEELGLEPEEAGEA